MALTRVFSLRICGLPRQLALVFAVQLLFFSSRSFAQKATGSQPLPKDITILNEHKDEHGNTIRNVRYFQGTIKVTETIIIPPAIPLITSPLRPDTLNKDSVMLVIDKKERSLQVYYRKHLLRAYKAVFGPKPLENKCMEGDRCTPEGWFRIIGKNPNSKYDKFLQLNYPDDSAFARFNRLKETGKLANTARIGGSLGIHGIWKGGDDMIEMGIGWTDGCIALKNKDVDELYNLVHVGTRVYIKK